MGVRGVTQKACVRNRGGRIPEVCIVWPSGTTNTVFPSICRAATTCWAEVIWLKGSLVWCSPNVQSWLWGARLSFFHTMMWAISQGEVLLCRIHKAAFWQIYALIVVPHPFLLWFPFFREGKRPAGRHKALSLSVMSFTLCSSLAQRYSWTQSYRGHFQSVWERGSRFQRFPRTDVG